jgi:hypothetical protein
MKASDNIFPKLDFAEGSAPATPSSGDVRLYAKADGLLYSKDDAGVETALGVSASVPYDIIVPIGDETTAITTGTAKVTMRAPRAFTLTAVKASLTTSSSSGAPAFDVNKNGSTVFSTPLTIDASETTSATAATPSVLGTTAIAADDVLTFDIDTAGTGAAGAKITLVGTVP